METTVTKRSKCCADCGSTRIVELTNAEQREQVWQALGDGGSLRLNLRTHMWLWGPAPFYALLICLAISYYWNWESVTRTHCNNWQFWPSISSIIGNASPQKYVWRFFAAVSLIQRAHDGVVYFKLYDQWIEVPRFQMTRYERSWMHFLKWVICVTHHIEQVALLVLTYVSSSENYKVHELSFIVFAAASTTYMCAMALLDHRLNAVRRANLTKHAASSPVARRFAELVTGHRVKTALLVATLFTLALAAYLFVRHNTYCEDGMYSLFCLCEWLVVVMNVAYHVSMLFEIHHWDSLVFGRHHHRQPHTSSE